MARPTNSASSEAKYPERAASTDSTDGAVGNWTGSSTIRGSPPCASMISRSFSNPPPPSNALRTHPRALSSEDSMPATSTIRAAKSIDTASRSAGPWPRSVAHHSAISRALPTARPRGASIVVSTARILTPDASPMAIRRSASSRAANAVFMNAPRPTVTSSTSPSRSTASFLLIIDAAISGMLSTVAVASRSAYNTRSAGASVSVGPTTQHPTVSRTRRISWGVRLVRKPGIDSSLSSVPPVCPSPRPDTIGTTTPHAAARGAKTSEVLSPTPPVLCLSTLGAAIADKSRRDPESVIAVVSASVSSAVIPRSTTDISHADS